MPDQQARMTQRAAGVVGGLVGAVAGSKVGGKVARAAGVGGFGKVVLETTGSLFGSAVTSDASSKMVKNVHLHNRDRRNYEEDRRRAAESKIPGPMPEKPRGGWGGVKDVVSKTVSDVREAKSGRMGLFNGALSNMNHMTYTTTHKAAHHFGRGC